jgi:hypothetical protein
LAIEFSFDAVRPIVVVFACWDGAALGFSTSCGEKLWLERRVAAFSPTVTCAVAIEDPDENPFLRRAAGWTFSSWVDFGVVGAVWALLVAVGSSSTWPPDAPVIDPSPPH